MHLDTAVSHLHSPFKVQKTILGLFLFVFIFVACGGGDEVVEGETAVETPVPNAKTVCDESCRREGQCGDNADGQPVILGNSAQPETRNHDQTFPQDAEVSILATQEKILRYPTGEEQFQHLFFKVQLAKENGQVGWIADWCVVQ